jgi:hypothetical protein
MIRKETFLVAEVDFERNSRSFSGLSFPVIEATNSVRLRPERAALAPLPPIAVNTELRGLQSLLVIRSVVPPVPPAGGKRARKPLIFLLIPRAGKKNRRFGMCLLPFGSFELGIRAPFIPQNPQLADLSVFKKVSIHPNKTP